MLNKKGYSRLGVTFITFAIILSTMAISSSADAQALYPLRENESCINCHENLYYLHDTGQWFCIEESPMRCVYCHGGNPNAISQAEAHTNRNAHPIVKSDISKCQECHLEECEEHLEIFEQVAGISDVMVAIPYQPRQNILSEETAVVSVAEPVAHTTWVSFIEMIVLYLIAGLALTIYLVHKSQRRQK